MSRTFGFTAGLAACLSVSLAMLVQQAAGQEPFAEDPPASTAEGQTEAQPTIEGATTEDRLEQAKEQLGDVAETTQQTVDKLAEQVDQNQQAQEARAGILKPIYLLAEYFAFPTFHWVAFMLMVGGVIGFALQLVLGKLVVLANRGFSIKEILSDTVGLAISAIGLVLTTQAAAENSSFTQSAFAVLTATVAGGLLGFVLYVWGQSQELQAVQGRSKEN